MSKSCENFKLSLQTFWVKFNENCTTVEIILGELRVYFGKIKVI